MLTFHFSRAANKYMFKDYNKRCEICSKLTIKPPEQRLWSRSSIFIVNFKNISYIALAFLLLTLNKYTAVGWQVWKSVNFLQNSKYHQHQLHNTDGKMFFKRCEICSTLIIKTPEPHQWCRCGVFVNFELISHDVSSIDPSLTLVGDWKKARTFLQ